MCKKTDNDASSAAATTSKKAVTASKELDFIWSLEDEPHAARRKEILAKYPEIKQLFGPHPLTKWVILGLVSLQLTLACVMRSAPAWLFVLTAYVVGGTCNHMLMLGMHELAHNLCFKKPLYNRWLAIFANLPLVAPSAASFKRYHLEHHKYQGEDFVDVDIPTRLEGLLFRTTLTKLFFVIFQLVFYALRPLIVSPKNLSVWEAINWVVVVSVQAALYLAWGPWATFYMALSSFLGAGLHPVAGHFIAEHYVFDDSAETYSYYGWLNIFAFNVGYHNEHHDFPFVAGYRLPEVRRIAAEYYDNLPQCESWIMVLYNFITDPKITAFSRVKRSRLTAEELKQVKAQ